MPPRAQRKYARPSCKYIALFAITLSLVMSQISSARPLAHSAARVISTDAAVTQIIFALGADQALVGTDVTSHLPEGYRELAQVGYHRALSGEGLLSLNPTLVIGSEHIGPPNILTTLAAAEVSVLLLRPALSIAHLKSNINKIAAAIGQDKRLAMIFEQLDSQQSAIDTASMNGKKIALALSVDKGKLRIAGANTSAQAFIELVGASNIGAFNGYRTLTTEALLDLAPDLILIASHEGATPKRVIELNPIMRHSVAAQRNLILPFNAANLVAGLSLGAIADAANLVTQVTHTMDTQ